MILDSDAAFLYKVKTKRINKAVNDSVWYLNCLVRKMKNGKILMRKSGGFFSDLLDMLRVRQNTNDRTEFSCFEGKQTVKQTTEVC